MGLDQCITNVYTLSEAGKSVATKSLGTSKSGKSRSPARSVAHSAESYPRGARGKMKKEISIRVDEDVLDYFKSEGDGYQRRINAVLRSYMQQKAKPKKRA